MKKYSTIQEAYNEGKRIGRLEGMYAALIKLHEQTGTQCKKLASQIQKGGNDDEQ